jgi:hypothetical protein
MIRSSPFVVRIVVNPLRKTLFRPFCSNIEINRRHLKSNSIGSVLNTRTLIDYNIKTYIETQLILCVSDPNFDRFLQPGIAPGFR